MWAHVLVAIIGAWVAAAPAVLGLEGAAKNNSHIVGPLVMAFALIAVSEVTRGLRWLNVFLGLWLMLAPWILGSDLGLPLLNSIAAGLLIAGLSLVKGARTEEFGGGWSRLSR